MRSSVLSASILCALVSTAVSAQVPIAPQPASIEGAVTHVYKTAGDVQLRLHVFSPADHRASSTRPAIVFFFGGGWVSGTVQQFVPQSKHLAERGMIAIAADYRVRSRHNTTPFEAMADARSAMRWVRSHAKELGIDPSRLAAAGGSSGGHIAVSTAVFDRFDDPAEDKRISATPDALILFNPAVDTGASEPPVMNDRFGGRGREGSPLAHLSRGLPPTLIVHGKADATVPYLSVERFCAEASKLGSRCELVGYEGAGHGFFNPGRDGGKWYKETLAEMDRFLTSLGYLPKPASTASLK
jgi:acetyl esterase